MQENAKVGTRQYSANNQKITHHCDRQNSFPIRLYAALLAVVFSYPRSALPADLDIAFFSPDHTCGPIIVHYWQRHCGQTLRYISEMEVCAPLSMSVGGDTSRVGTPPCLTSTHVHVKPNALWL